MARLHKPNDPSLPYFAYDAFKPKQVAFPVIEHFVDYVEPFKFYSDDYELRHRNGIPMVVENHSTEPIKGYLIHFNTNFVKGYNDKPNSDAYDFICKTKPRSLFKWRQLSDDGVDFNITLGQNMQLGTPYTIYENMSNYSGRNDPTFYELLSYIEDNVWHMKNIDGIRNDCDSLYKLEMNYMLLWSSIDKYLFLCNGGWFQHNNVIEWSKWDEFILGFKEEVNRYHQVHSTNSNKICKLNPNSSTSSAEYYYQLRCNIVHSGKKDHADVSFIEKSICELLRIFKKVLDVSFNEERYKKYDLAHW